MLKFTIKGNLGGPEPDGFVVKVQDSNIGKFYADGRIGIELHFTPEEFREFWADAGAELRAFDERGGAPSNEE